MAPRTPINSVADLPFARLDTHTLLHLHPDRRDLDLDNYGFGYGFVPELVLHETEGDRRTSTVTGCLLLALHSYEESPEDESDIEVAFWLDEDEYYEDEDPDDAELVVLAPLTLFLRRRLPTLVAEYTEACGEPPTAVVLALCNPQRTVLRRPEDLVSPPIRYALGDVTSWMESDEQGETWDPNAPLRLNGEQWLTLP